MKASITSIQVLLKLFAQTQISSFQFNQTLKYLEHKFKSQQVRTTAYVRLLTTLSLILEIIDVTSFLQRREYSGLNC